MKSTRWRRHSSINLHLLLLLLPTVLLTGCVVLPVPHVTKESPRTLGRVVDAETGAPVEGAVVQLTTVDDWNQKPQPGAHARTGADGTFELGSRYNFHLALYANPSWAIHFPPGSYWEGKLLVTREYYAPLSFRFPHSWHGGRDRNWVHVGDLRLGRRRTESPCPPQP